MNQQGIIPVKEKLPTSQRVWRSINIVLAFILVYCVPGFLSFKNMAFEKGYHFIQGESWFYCFIGFAIYGVILMIYRLSNIHTSTSSKTSSLPSSIPSSKEIKKSIKWNWQENLALTPSSTPSWQLSPSTTSACIPGFHLL